MTRPDAHAVFEELAAGHALAALEPEEEQAFLRHLSGCARCERDLSEHLSTLAHLAYAPDAAEPPAALLGSLRAAVQESGREVTWPGQQEAPASLDQARERRVAAAASMRRARTWTSIAAGAALVVGLGVWNVTLQSDRQQQDAWGDRLTSAVRELGEDGTDTVPLKGADGKVVAVALVHGDRMSLLVDGLPANDDASTTYVLWGKSRFGDVRPVAAFDVDEVGIDVRKDLTIQAGVAEVTRFMVTREQGRSAPPFPSPVLAAGNVVTGEA